MTNAPQSPPLKTKDEIINEIRNLKRKTALMQYCHGRLATYYTERERLLTVSLTLLAGVALLATTVDARELLVSVDEKALRGIASALTFIVFILTLYRFEHQPATKAGLHATALNSFTRFLRRIDLLLESLDKKTITDLEGIGQTLAQEYSDIASAAPLISAEKFLKYKQQHLQTSQISRALDKAPFKSIRQIKAELTNLPPPSP